MEVSIDRREKRDKERECVCRCVWFAGKSHLTLEKRERKSRRGEELKEFLH